ncbi:glycoside hydrolase family 3 protein [Oceanobacillus chungangensis]|uniref:beta-glucosidase n=1 Tax=Oceanobacillus chungangensis TaxID=1229152 RepID=A0A3D8PJN1_9BACI|nr:glycoside hydrolase family 3 N-terminal domain-containing protein [Oceanobacillus chungangensis]RDW15439.1 beta-glucosidase [Oceanobacillus chungangensis]
MSGTCKKNITYFLSFILSFQLFIVPQVNAQGEVKVVSRTKEILEIGGKRFRDLNNNGSLDPYENWELSDEERVEDLLTKLTIEEKVGLMTINEYPEIENDKLVMPNQFLDQHTRYFIFRGTQRADMIANLNNQLQEQAEASRLGIPVVVVSNPRNHPLTIPNIEEEGQFSHWPDTLGFAAMRDEELAKEFGEIASKEWIASGIRKMYGYSADVATDPLWARVQETFGENPELISSMIFNITKGFQGDILNENSVTMTTRHFPGGGARVKGRDSHFEEGKAIVYPTPGSLLKYHIPPFKAAIEADTTSIMPDYAYPSNESADQGLTWFSNNQQFEEKPFALNEQFIQNLLREELGFLGYVNSDTSAVIDRAWGAQDLPIEQRFAEAINSGVNIFSGVPNTEPILNALNQGLVDVEKINRSVTYILTEMMQLGLFENPYVDPDAALKIANDRESQEKADEAHRKSVVLLRNDDNLLPLNDEKINDVKLYVEMFPGGENDTNTQELKGKIRKYDNKIKIVDRLEDATHAFVWVKPWQDLFKNNPSLTIGPVTGIEQADRIVTIQQTVPTITAINMSNPWLINQIEPNAAAVISTFGVKTEALFDVIRGKFNPTGKLPFTIPASQEAVNNDIGDIPGYDEGPAYVYKDKNGNAYGFDFGISYGGNY